LRAGFLVSETLDVDGSCLDLSLWRIGVVSHLSFDCFLTLFSFDHEKFALPKSFNNQLVWLEPLHALELVNYGDRNWLVLGAFCGFPQELISGEIRIAQVEFDL
jgi:hypothetical protein